MKQELSFKQAVFIVGLMMVAFFLVIKFHGEPIKPVENIALAEQVVSGLPIRLKIPSINIDAPIEQVDLAPDGSMDVPKAPPNAAWFNLGPRPGENGSAVIDGHFGWKNNIPAVFDHLNKLQKGDKIYIVDDKGVTITFVVRETRIFVEKDNTSTVFSSSDGKAHLNLITCEGIWNKVTKSYSGRLVVFADKE